MSKGRAVTINASVQLMQDNGSNSDSNSSSSSHSYSKGTSSHDRCSALHHSLPLHTPQRTLTPEILYDRAAQHNTVQYSAAGMVIVMVRREWNDDSDEGGEDDDGDNGGQEENERKGMRRNEIMR